MKNCLLSIGSFPGRALSSVLSAFSCGAVNAVSELHIFHLSDQKAVVPAASLAGILSRCRDLVNDAGEGLPFLQTRFSFHSCTADLPSEEEYAAGLDSAALLFALHGNKWPLSFHENLETNEWAFSCLLKDRPNDSCDSLFSFLDSLHTELASGGSVRLSVLCDLTDPFSAGAAFALLPWLRSAMPRNLAIGLIALAETTLPLDESFFSDLRRSLADLDQLSFVPAPGEAPVSCADAVWFISLPSTLLDSERSHSLTFFAAARALSAFCAADHPVPAGFHTCEVSGVFSLHALGFRAAEVSAFLEFSTWMISDLLPSVRGYMDHPSRFPVLPNSRNALFRSLLALSPADRLSESLTALEQALRALLQECVSFLESVPSALRYSDAAQVLWQKATDACGRYITVASEVDVTREEIRASGLEGVKPVHRDSMADTDEEQLQKQLEDMTVQLENETRMRDEALASVGPFRSVQARRDCLLKCREALESAEKRIAALPADTTDHLTFALQERRIRLLRSAVLRCESDLSYRETAADAAETFSAAMATPVVLTQASLQALRKALNHKAAESSLRELRESLPVLLQDVSLPDEKELMKALLSSPRGGSTGQPLTDLAVRAWRICRDACSALRFPSESSWPAVPMLPDLFPAGTVSSPGDLLSLIPPEASHSETDEAELRGLLSMLILAQYKRPANGGPKLVTVACPDHSPLARFWLSGRHESGIYIISLENSDTVLPFAVCVPGRIFIPAVRNPAHQALIPGFVTWYHQDSGSFDDPCAFLSDGDRLLLSGRLEDILGSWPENTVSALKSFLEQFRIDLSSGHRQNAEDPKLAVRIRAVCGLQHLPAYQDILRRVPIPYEHTSGIDPVAACLTGLISFRSASCGDIPDDVLYTWRGIPFARESASLVLESTFAPGEAEALLEMESECKMLSGISDDYRDALFRETAALLDRFPDSCGKNAELLRRIIRKAEKPFSDLSPELVWPWNPESPSIRTILAECLGSGLSGAVSAPFSDMLAVFPARGADAIGDSYFGVLCSVLPYDSVTAPSSGSPVISPDAVLPPLSPALVSAICVTSEGRLLLTPDFIRVDHPDEQSFRITLLMNGSFPLRLTRIYRESEILYLYAHDLPTVALWPSVPFPEDRWRAYYVYARLPESYAVSVLPAGSSEPVPLEGNSRRFAAEFSRFPAAFLFSKENQTVGALPNLLPEPETVSGDETTVCVDFGSAGISVVLSVGDTRKPLQGTSAVRIILNNPASTPEYLRREFLPAVPVSALLPSVLQVFRPSVADAPVPFVDGSILMSANLRDAAEVPDDTLSAGLKWTDNADSARSLCLHQVMLMAALQARTDGASGISWRFAVPDDMSPAGRESFAVLLRRLADRVAEESGYISLAGPVPRILFASESTALGAYFRLCAREDTRGGFMVLDLGAGTADISLFLRGKQQAVRTCQIPLGVHHMLLPSLLRDPLMLHQEFGTWPDERFREDLAAFSRILEAAGRDPSALPKAGLALDHFLSDYYPTLLSALGQLGSAGFSSRFGAVLLLHLSYVTMLSGLVLLQIAADPAKNDFLPEQMSLCLAGRGSLLMESLPDSLKSELWRFLTMFRNKRVASLSLLFSSEKKMEIPVGLSVMQELSDALPPPSSVSAAIAVRPEELLPEFLLRFLRVFPGEAGLLFPDFFSGDYYHPFTPAGEAVVTKAIDQAFAARDIDIPRPYHALADWIALLLDLSSASRPLPPA